MKTELLALIDELVKFKLHAADGKFSAEKDARQIRSNIEFLLGQPQSPEFDFAAKLKLEDLLARGYTVSGLALEKPAADGRSERGFITAGGFVGWWRDPALSADARRLEFISTIEDCGQGLRYEVNCLVNNGVNTFKIFDGQTEEFLGWDGWFADVPAAIDAAIAAQAAQKNGGA